MSGTELEIPETLDANPALEDTAQPQGERLLSPREIVMAAAVARRQEQMDADNAQAAIYSREATEAGLNFPQEDAPDPEPAPRAREVPPASSLAPSQDRFAPVAPVQAPAAPQVRTINIDGQQYTVTDQQADELIRLGMYANQAMRQYQPEPAPDPEPPRPIVDAAAVRDVVRKLQFSGEDDAAAALTELITNVRVPQAQPLDQNALVSRAISATTEHMRVVAAQEQIQREYADIATNPQLAFLANTNKDAILLRNQRAGIQQSWIDIYREASNNVYDAIGRPRPGSDPQQLAAQATSGNVVPLRENVLERKRTAPRGTQAIDLRAPAPVAPRAPTGSEIVDKMREQRGQMSLR